MNWLLNRAALLLWPDAPNAGLARTAGRPKSSCRSWRSGHRRVPTYVLERLRLSLQARAAECNTVWDDICREIARRQGEPLRRRGFMEIRERDGPGSIPRDGRNRLGRPRKRFG